MSNENLHDRLNSVSSGHTYRAIAELTQTHPETVRRYMQGQSPSVEFLAALCPGLGINADWLLTGRGAQRADQIRAHALQHADPAELHSAIATTISALVERVDRLETYCQTLETRLRGQTGGTRSPDTDDSKSLSSVEDAGTDPPQVVTRARRVADAVAKRPHHDAH
jgi:transcriptional regulator with XRE-family HTH domain